MARFTTRVQLAGSPGEQVYNQLHAAMEAEGFSREITDDDTHETFHLPHAEYNKIGEFTRVQVLNAAKAAADTLNREYSLLVTESKGRTWYNLEPT